LLLEYGLNLFLGRLSRNDLLHSPFFIKKKRRKQRKKGEQHPRILV